MLFIKEIFKSKNVNRIAFLRKKFSSIGEVVVRANEISFGYTQTKLVLDEVNFSVRRGSKVTIMGQNGSGKSTILKLISGSIKPTSGIISTSLNSGISIAKQVLSREDYKLTVYNYFKRQLQDNELGIESRIMKALGTVKLIAPLDREISTFSGGQQARLLLAAALIQDPDVIIIYYYTKKYPHSLI